MRPHRTEDVAITIVTEVLPASLFLPSPPDRGRIRGKAVYLEMRTPYGRSVILPADRMHMEDLYVATCYFDQYGIWHLRWRGLENETPGWADAIRVDVVHPEDDPLYETGGVC